MAGRTVVVVGGGIGGVVAARRLRRRLDRDDRVVLVTRTLRFSFAPSYLWVMSGDRRPERISVDLGRLRARGIELVEAEAEQVDRERRTLRTTAGEFAWDRLVLAPGAELAPELVPGFAETALTPYTLDGAARAGALLEEFAGGRVVVLVAGLPYKCPAAPYETALLAEALLRRRGLRNASSVDVYTPEPAPMPVAGPLVGEAVVGVLASRGIGFHPQQQAGRVEPRTLTLTDGAVVEFDLLLGVPPHRPPALATASGLAGEGGWISVDAATLATEADGVFAVGDATAIPLANGKPLPKAGVFAERQAETVADRIADELAGRTPLATFDGHGSCFLESGGGAAAYASGDFYASPAPDVKVRGPGRTWHGLKVLFEQYWLRRRL